MYKEFDVLRGVQLEEIEDTLNNVYVIDVCCDANDGDYMYDTITMHEDNFEQNELFMLVLAYLSEYGEDLSGDRTWLREYAIDMNLLIFAGMCDSYCHSINSIDIVYYDEDGVAFKVSLPPIDSLFSSEEEAKEYMSSLYERAEPGE